MTDIQLLKQLIKDSGLKKSFIAAKLGMSLTGFHKYLIGQVEFRASQIRAMCDLLHIEDPALAEAVFYARRADNDTAS